MTREVNWSGQIMPYLQLCRNFKRKIAWHMMPLATKQLLYGALFVSGNYVSNLIHKVVYTLSADME